MSGPTLVELLDDEAAALEARAEGESNADDAADYRDRAAHLAEASERIREAMRHPHRASLSALIWVNGGPLDTRSEPTRCVCPFPRDRCPGCAYPCISCNGTGRSTGGER